MATESTDDYLESAEVVQILNIDRSTLSRWVTSGRIKPAMKLRGLRGAFLFAPTEVERVRQQSSSAAAS